MSQATFWGYARPDGSVGIRNVIAVISVMDNCNPVTRAVAQAVQGTVYLPGSYIRGQLARDREITLHVTAGLCLNPNVAGVVVIGLEPGTTRELVELIKPSGKPVEVVNIQLCGGTIQAIAEGTRAALQLSRQASKQRRQEFPLSKLNVGLECGGSDTTSGLASNPSIGVVADYVVANGGTAIITETSEFFGAEHLFAERAATPDVGEEDPRHHPRARAGHRRARHRPARLQPVARQHPRRPHHHRGEGARRNVEGRQVEGDRSAVLRPGADDAGPALHGRPGARGGVDHRPCGGGCQMCLFSTGVGNAIGHPVATVVKISGNRNTLNTMPDNIDFDVTGILEKNESVKSAGERLTQYALSVASGELTTSELLDTRDSAISRFGISM